MSSKFNTESTSLSTDAQSLQKQQSRRVRIGIDVGGTFTKAVAIDSTNDSIISTATVPTTHDTKRGVSDGILDAFTKVTTMRDSQIALDDIDFVSHSTTQAINALLESDTYPVGIIAMGVGPTKKDVIKRTRLDGNSILHKGQHADDFTVHKGLKFTNYEFLDTSHLITEKEVSDVINRMQNAGVKCLVATEMYGVDDPSNEEFVAKQSAVAGLPCTSSHEVSGTYGLEIRTLTAAVNASIMPKTIQVANFVESTMSQAGVKSPLLIMRGDGGVTSMDTFRSKPILTVLSGPAASVAGALLYLRITNGIFIEVGGTSTNICIIKDGKPTIRYATIRDHPTCIRSMDVRIIGVAGGSMVAIHKKKVHRVGPRSAHIAGLTYSCFADASDIESGEIVLMSPKQGDAAEYAAIKCKDGKMYAITNTCAANALDRIESGDYSKCQDITAAKTAMRKLGDAIGGVSYSEVAMSIILTSIYDITNTVSRILKEYKMNASTTKIIGGGGGASVLVPEVAKHMGIEYERAPHAEVISSIGVASSMLQDEIEVAMVDPTPESISAAHKNARLQLVDKGAVPESIRIDSSYMPDKGLLRITAIGSVAMDAHATQNVTYDNSNLRATFDLDEALNRASEITNMDKNLINLEFESDHYMILVGHKTKRRHMFSKKNKHRILVLDRFGQAKLDVADGIVFQGGRLNIIEELDAYLESRHTAVAPQVYLIDDTRMLDFSGLTSSSHILNAVQDEMEDNTKVAVIVEL